MVEYSLITLDLDTIFGALSDQTRRDILKRLLNKELSVGELAKPYNLTFAAVSKHLKVLERAKLILKQRRGKEQMVHIDPAALRQAADYLSYYQQLWEGRFSSLDKLLQVMED